MFVYFKRRKSFAQKKNFKKPKSLPVRAAVSRAMNRLQLAGFFVSSPDATEQFPLRRNPEPTRMGVAGPPKLVVRLGSDNLGFCFSIGGGFFFFPFLFFLPTCSLFLFSFLCM
jgi:hypothetical protein